MKQAVVQQAIPGAIGVQDFTDAVFSGGDCKLMLNFVARNTANNSVSSHGGLGIGATDKTGLGATGFKSQDNVTASTSPLGYQIAAAAAMMPNVNSGSLDTSEEANITGVTHPANGIQLNWIDIGGAYLTNALLLGGSDIEVSVKVVQLNGTTPVSVNSGLSGPPDLVIAKTACAADSVTGPRASKGWYVRSQNAYVGETLLWAIGVSPSRAVKQISASWLVAEINGAETGLAWSATLSNFSGATFDITASGPTTDQVILICIKGVTAKCGWANTPTTSGNAGLGAALGVAPTTVLLMPTYMSALDALATDNNASNCGLGAAVNNGGATQQAVSVIAHEDNVANSNSWSYSSNTKCAVALGATDGAPDVEAAVNAWQSDDLQLAYIVTGTPGAKKLGWLALGAAVTPIAFSVAPNLGSVTDASALFTFILNRTGTVYGVAVRKGSDQPNATQLKTGKDSGGNDAKASFTESVVASVGDSGTFAGLLVPNFDCYFIGSDGVDDTSIVAVLNVFKDAPDGLQYTVGAFKQIDAITQGNPAQVTVLEGHGLVTGDFGRIFGSQGMTPINSAPMEQGAIGWYDFSKVNDDNVTLQFVNAANPNDWEPSANVNSIAYPAYSGGGIVTHGPSVAEGASPTVVDGVVIISTAVDQHNHPNLMQADGVPVIDAGGTGGAHTIRVNIYYPSTDSYANGTLETDTVAFTVGEGGRGLSFGGLSDIRRFDGVGINEGVVLQ